MWNRAYDSRQLHRQDHDYVFRVFSIIPVADYCRQYPTPGARPLNGPVISHVPLGKTLYHTTVNAPHIVTTSANLRTVRVSPSSLSQKDMPQ